MKLVFLVLSAFLVWRANVQGAYGLDFDPRSYDAQAGKMITCEAVKRTGVAEAGSENALIRVEHEERVPIQLHYVDVNPTAKKTILMVHGWPSLWSLWRNQIEEFKDDYRLIVPSLRGFGNSTHPGNVKFSGTIQDNVGDLTCILNHAGVREAICMGHDWGSQICYEMARSRPDITEAVVGVSVPYLPAGEVFTPIRHLVKYFPGLMYMVYFDDKMETAVAELEGDVRRTLRASHRSIKNPPPEAFLKSGEAILAVYGDAEISPIPYVTPEEEDYFVEQISIQGFKNTVHFYQTENRYQSWKFVHDQGNRTLPQPVLTIYPSKDGAADWKLFAQMAESEKFIPNWTTKTVTGTHNVHLENPTIFNTIVRRWLTALETETDGNRKTWRAADEL